MDPNAVYRPLVVDGAIQPDPPAVEIARGIMETQTDVSSIRRIKHPGKKWIKYIAPIYDASVSTSVWASRNFKGNPPKISILSDAVNKMNWDSDDDAPDPVQRGIRRQIREQVEREIRGREWAGDYRYIPRLRRDGMGAWRRRFHHSDSSSDSSSDEDLADVGDGNDGHRMMARMRQRRRRAARAYNRGRNQ
jgi:hypothetical protein